MRKRSVKVRIKCVACGDFFYRYRTQVRKGSKYCSVKCLRVGPHYSEADYSRAASMSASDVFCTTISLDRNALRVVEKLQEHRHMNRSAAVKFIIKEWARMKAEQNIPSLAAVAAFNPKKAA